MAGFFKRLARLANRQHSVRTGTALDPTSTSGKQPQSNERYDLYLE